MIKFICKNFGKYKKYAIFCVVATLLEAITYLMVPTFMSRIFDVGLANNDRNYIFRIGILMIVLSLLAMGLGIYENYASAVSSQGMGMNIRLKLFNRIIDLSPEKLDKFSESTLITRLNSDVNAIQTATMQFMRMFLNGFWRVLVAIILAAFINVKLSFILIAGIIIFTFVMAFVFGLVMPWFSKMQNELDQINRVTNENIIAQRIIKLFNRKTHEEEKFNEPNQKLTVYMSKGYGIMMIIMPFTTLIMNGIIAAILWFGGIKTGFGIIGVGDLNAFLSYAVQVCGALSLISMVSVQIGKAITSSGRVMEVLKVQSDSINTDDIKHTIQNADITFKNVSFTYKGNTTPTLEDINFSIKPGSFVGVIGSTGEGKTTLVNLLLRFYEVNKGAITIDGNNINNYSIKYLREKIALVSQKNVLFSGSIKENIRWGNPNASDFNIQKACEAAQAGNFINHLAENYDTHVEQGGLNFSGGQRQRLCIARALIKNPKVLILDDSTSALDQLTEAAIRKTLNEDYKEVTKIMISQKISSIESCDLIIVLNGGKVNGLGTHAELLNNNSIYQEIYNSQKKETV